MVRRPVSCQTLDERLEQALVTLDPDGMGQTTLDRVVGFDWEPLIELMQGDMAPEEAEETGMLLALAHKLARFRDMIEPYSREDGPLASQLSKLSLQSANPYRKRTGSSKVAAEVHRVL